MSQGRRVCCVTGDPDVTDHVRAALTDAGPGIALDTVTDTNEIDHSVSYAVSVVTDVGVDDVTTVVSDLLAEAPGHPILVAARNGSGVLASDVLVAGATAYVPLDDTDRLRDHLERFLEPTSDPDQFFNHLVEHVGVGVGAYGREGTITYANPAYADLLDLEPDELTGREIWTVNPDLDQERFEGYFDSFTPGETRHADALHQRSDGSVVPIHTVTTRVDLDGTPLHVGTIMDISARVETQRKIEALHDVANALTEPESASEVQELVVDAADRILDLHACYFIEHQIDHFVVTASTDVAPVDQPTIPEGKGVVWETFDSREPILVTDAPEHPTAQPSSDIIRSAVSVPVGDYGVFQAVSTEPGAFTDEDLELADLLATHASAALDRVRFTSAIRNERDRLAALFENVPNPVVEYEIGAGDSTIATDVNPAFVDVFGYDVEEFVGSDIDEMIVPPDDFERAQSYNQDLIAGKNITAEVERVTAEGPRDFLLDVVPLAVDEENAGGYAIYTDITDQKQRERLLERQNDRLEEFASVVSHDLRNPLNVATGRLDLAAQTATDPTAEHIEHARDALERMDDLIADLLTLAREGRSLGTTEPVDLATIAQEAWSSVETDEATLDIDEAPTVNADADRVRQLFENLFRNAVEHGGPDVVVTVQATPGGFTVTDNGPGIPESERHRVFTSGFTTSTEGTGFGLSIVERIAGAHGWSVELGESENGGASFRFSVPDAD